MMRSFFGGIPEWWNDLDLNPFDNDDVSVTPVRDARKFDTKSLMIGGVLVFVAIKAKIL